MFFLFRFFFFFFFFFWGGGGRKKETYGQKYVSYSPPENSRSPQRKYSNGPLPPRLKKFGLCMSMRRGSKPQSTESSARMSMEMILVMTTSIMACCSWRSRSSATAPCCPSPTTAGSDGTELLVTSARNTATTAVVVVVLLEDDVVVMAALATLGLAMRIAVANDNDFIKLKNGALLEDLFTDRLILVGSGDIGVGDKADSQRTHSLQSALVGQSRGAPPAHPECCSSDDSIILRRC